MSRHPEVKWAQRADNVYVTILLPDAQNAKVNLEPDGVLIFSATAGAGNNQYELKLDLHDKVNVEESKINIAVRSIFCVIKKAENRWWKKLLRGDGKAPHFLKVDWDKWVDEDDDEIGNDMDMGGMDFSKFGGGMGNDIEDIEDEDEVVDSPTNEGVGTEEPNASEEADKAEPAAAKEEATSS